ncbi:uncharacterized protein LOC143470980 [Clavelina lepadiformis]|uniref:uncharacterized protein LOC143470980 n=1 Tax=Clavelina lepadiformis TaxID=159417 RepID=UPI00404295D6
MSELYLHVVIPCAIFNQGSFAMSLLKENENATEAPTETETRPDVNSALTSLAVIIGSIIASFVVILLLQWAIKKFLCKNKSSANNENRESAQVTHLTDGSLQITIPQCLTKPPSYDVIHKYKQLDLATSTPIYYSVPGLKNFYGVLSKWPQETEEDIDEQSPPPAYEDNDAFENDLQSTSSLPQQQTEE